jgi:hypothetical protein
VVGIAARTDRTAMAARAGHRIFVLFEMYRGHSLFRAEFDYIYSSARYLERNGIGKRGDTQQSEGEKYREKPDRQDVIANYMLFAIHSSTLESGKLHSMIMPKTQFGIDG